MVFYVLARNIHAGSRKYYCNLPHFLGKLTLESYLMQVTLHCVTLCRLRCTAHSATSHVHVQTLESSGAQFTRY